MIYEMNLSLIDHYLILGRRKRWRGKEVERKTGDGPSRLEEEWHQSIAFPRSVMINEGAK